MIKLNFLCEEKIYAEIDTGLMNQVLYNLIENAIKFSDKDEEVDIQVRENKF